MYKSDKLNVISFSKDELNRLSTGMENMKYMKKSGNNGEKEKSQGILFHQL